MRADDVSKGVIFLPYIMGERAPYWDTEAKGAFLGLTMVTGRKEIIRSVLEGVVFHLRLILEILEENVGNISEIRLIGGGSKSIFLQQLMANIWGKKIIPMRYMGEATALGAAIAAMVSLGIKKDFYDAESLIKKSGEIIPDYNKYSKYTKFYKIFTKAYLDLKKINKQLDKLIKRL